VPGIPPYRNAAYSFEVALVSQADVNIFQVGPTLAVGDVTVSQDGGAFNNITALPIEIGATGVLTVDLTDGEMDGDRVAVLFHDAVGAEWQDLLVTIETGARQTDDLAYADELYEGALTLRHMLRIMLSALAGLSTGGGTANVAFRDVADTLNRIEATVTVNGNRTVIALDGT
jgi:hypothetical protein